MKRDIPNHWKAQIADNPNSERSQKYLAIQKRLLSISFYENKAESAVKRSHVGTRLMNTFKQSVGAIPCSACKQMVLQLNQMSIGDIRADHDRIVIEIEKNARKAKASWWSQLMIRADEIFTDGIVTRLFISKLLSEACDDDEREASGLMLGSDYHSDYLDSMATR